MNIFIMILLAVLMMGYYVISSPSSRIQSQEADTAVEISDMHSIAECAVAVHNAKIKGGEFDDICVNQNDIHSEFVCLNQSLAITPCQIQNKKKPAYSFIITATGPMPYEKYNNMMEILEKYYADAGTFGILQGNSIVSGGTTTKRIVPKSVISQMNLTDGQLIYLTQYEIPDTESEFSAPQIADVQCPPGTAKTYRFGRWQCIGINTKTDCAGDMIWDSDLSECIPDESRKPLCDKSQTAVVVDDVWECVDPFADRTCPAQMVSRLNYNTLEWECIEDPTKTTDTTKCKNIIQGATYGKPGATLSTRNVSCTDCEKMIVNEETCVAICVPDESRLNDPSCYPGNIRECSGPSRAIYFGFPSTSYISNIPEIQNMMIVFDAKHTQNRKFNCMDCGDALIDTHNSVFPYTAICNQ